MDFEIFRKVATRAYEDIPDKKKVFTLEQNLSIFEYFFKAYAERLGMEHIPIGKDNARRLMEKLPYIDEKDAELGYFDIDPETYPYLIDQYFSTKFFPGCNYRINHFMSAKIRELRLYEILFGREAAEAGADGMDRIKRIKEEKENEAKQKGGV